MENHHLQYLQWVNPLYIAIFLYHLYIRNDGLTIKNGYPLVMKKAIENGHLGR